MISFEYSKMSGAGNTFIMADGRGIPPGTDLAAITPYVCADAREHGGADGFIAIYPWADGDFEMRYYNRDGSTGMMCGNGGRCAVSFAADHGYVADRRSIRFTNAGVGYTAAFTERGVKVSFPDPKRFELGMHLDLFGAERLCHFADVGTPHVVLFIDELAEPGIMHLSEMDLPRWGAGARRHQRFAPAGANANFVEVKPEGSAILLRTFERGVEGETGACGTGAISSAIIASLLRGLTPPVAVTTTSGATLWVNFRREGDRVTEVSLEGGADVVSKGTMVVV